MDLDNLFYRNQKQITELVDKFGKRVLTSKESDSVFHSRYRDFKYSDELAKIKFDYEPQNTSDFIDEFSSLFENTINFDMPGVMYNIHPNVNIYSQVASFFSSLANPNFCMDLPSGKLLLIEKAVINYLNQLAGWDANSSGGFFTFGGKGTLLYALKVGLSKTIQGSSRRGVWGRNYVISNNLGHPSHIQICNWLGIGRENCIRLATYDGIVRVEDIESSFISIIKQGGRLPLIILNGMTTNNHTFDDVKSVRAMVDNIVKVYSLDYTPHIHVDSVLGWIYLLLSRYDFNKNPLNICPRVLSVLKAKTIASQQIKFADSFAADFHKTGYCSYVSSVFLVKDKRSLFAIEGKYSEDENMTFSEYAPYDFTLESSRSPHGPVSAYSTLKTLGVEGFTKILANHTEAFFLLKSKFSKTNAIVCNSEENSNLIFLILKPEKYRDLNIDIDTNQDIADEIKDFNTGFYSFLLEKAKKHKIGVFFSCSRSYKYMGKSYGCLKLYNFNSHFDRKTVEEIYSKIDTLLNEYVRYIGDSTGIKNHNFFDYAEIKDVKDV